MEKIDNKYRINFTKEELLEIDEYVQSGKKYDMASTLGMVLAEVQRKQNEIIEWINEHEKYVQPLEKAWRQAVEETLEQVKEKQKEHK